MTALKQLLRLAALLLLAALPLVAAQGADDCGPDCTSVFIQPLFEACLLNVSSSATVLPDNEQWDDARM